MKQISSALIQLGLWDMVRPAAPRVRSARAPRQHKVVVAPELHLLWGKIQAQYFPDRPDLLEYSVSWSRRRQKRVLASCNIRQKRVVVATELSYVEHTQWLEPLLYHEMCHAALGTSIQRKNGRRAWHGREFRALERKHPRIQDLDHWIKSGGWHHAVRSHRGRVAAQRRFRTKVVNR